MGVSAVAPPGWEIDQDTQYLLVQAMILVWGAAVIMTKRPQTSADS